MYSADPKYLNAKAAYQMSKDSCLFETRDMLRQMQEVSNKESVLQTKRFIIQTVLSVASLIVSDTFYSPPTHCFLPTYRPL